MCKFMYRICIINILFLVILFAKDSNLLLLKNFDSKIINDNNIAEFLISEKLDGMRAVWNGNQFISRSGNVINAPKCFTQHYPNLFLDGELWSKRDDFNNIISIIKKLNISPKNNENPNNCYGWENIKFYVFDVLPLAYSPIANAKSSANISLIDCNKKDEKLCFLESRLQILQHYLTDSINGQVTTIRIIKQEKLDSIHSLESKLDTLTKQGAEGLVIRKNNAPYTIGRSNYNFKLKKFQDSECKIKEITQGKGKYKGKMGAIICEQTLQSFTPHTHPKLNKNNKNETITFKIGSGFSESMRTNPPKIGTIITYKFQGFSKNGLPKFPTFLRIYSK